MKFLSKELPKYNGIGDQNATNPIYVAWSTGDNSECQQMDLCDEIAALRGLHLRLQHLRTTTKHRWRLMEALASTVFISSGVQISNFLIKINAEWIYFFDTAFICQDRISLVILNIKGENFWRYFTILEHVIFGSIRRTVFIAVIKLEMHHNSFNIMHFFEIKNLVFNTT